MPDLQAGTVITGTDAPVIGIGAVEGTTQSPTSTSYAAGTQVGCTFVAPTTGRVLVEWRGFIDNNTAGQTTYLSFEVRAGGTVGSGTAESGLPSDEVALSHEGQNQIRGGMFQPVDGLTPGATYNVRCMHRVSGGTGTVDDREITVTPLP